MTEGSASHAINARRAIAAFDLPDPSEAWLLPGLLHFLLPETDVPGDDVVPGPTG